MISSGPNAALAIAFHTNSKNRFRNVRPPAKTRTNKSIVLQSECERLNHNITTYTFSSTKIRLISDKVHRNGWY